jgi:GNAT superfamily N-acetyltransferase
MDNILIRDRLKPGDLGNIVRLHGEFYFKNYGFDVTFEPYVARPLSECILKQSKKEKVWVVECSGEFSGSIAIVENGPEQAQLRWFILDDRAKGKGIGRQLLEKAIVFSREQGYKEIILWTVSNLDQAIKLYELNGFKLALEDEHLLWGQMLVEQRYDLVLK